MTSPAQQSPLPDGPYSAAELDAREDAIRRAAVAWVLQWDGLVANPTAADGSWSRYREIVAPFEPDALADSMCRMSGCALFVRAYLRAVLRDTPSRIARNYVVGHAVADVHAIALECGGVRVPPCDPPKPGDVVRVLAPEHVYVITSIESRSYGWDVESIDGGQKVGEWQAIQAKRRTWTMKANGWIDHVEGSTGARLVMNVYDLGAMLRRYGVTDEMAPED